MIDYYKGIYTCLEPPRTHRGKNAQRQSKIGQKRREFKFL